MSIPIKSDRRRSDAFGNFLAQVIRTLRFTSRLVEVVLAGFRDETISQEVPFAFCVDESNRVDAEVGRGGITRGRWVLRRKECLGYRVTPQKLVERRGLCHSGPA